MDGSAPGKWGGSADLASALSGVDLVHAGPLTDVTFAVRQVWKGPLLAASWGFDLLDESARSEDARRQARTALSSADVVLVDNAVLAEAARDNGADPDAIFELPWGIDISYFCRGESSIRSELGWQDRTVIVSTRRLEPLYDVGTLIDAFVLAASDCPELALLIGGGGSLRAQFEERTVSAGLADRAVFLGEVGRDVLRDVYRAADLYVSTSPVDGTSVSLLEAMACGAPVCVTDIRPNAQWVDDSVGERFAVGDVRGLGRILSATAAAHDVVAVKRRQERVDRARASVVERADWSKAAAVLVREGKRAIKRHMESR